MRDEDDLDFVNVETHHERSDVNVRALLWVVVILVVFAAVTHGLLWVMFKHFAQAVRRDVRPPMTAIARPAGAAIPQEPRLQPFPTTERPGQVMPPNRDTAETDMAEMRRSEEEQLHTVGWVDKQNGIVRLPIDVAKQLVVQRGMPVVGEQRAASGERGVQH
jgi:hypothetical protein